MLLNPAPLSHNTGVSGTPPAQRPSQPAGATGSPPAATPEIPCNGQSAPNLRSRSGRRATQHPCQQPPLQSAGAPGSSSAAAPDIFCTGQNTPNLRSQQPCQRPPVETAYATATSFMQTSTSTGGNGTVCLDGTPPAAQAQPQADPVTLSAPPGGSATTTSHQRSIPFPTTSTTAAAASGPFSSTIGASPMSPAMFPNTGNVSHHSTMQPVHHWTPDSSTSYTRGMTAPLVPNTMDMMEGLLLSNLPGPKRQSPGTRQLPTPQVQQWDPKPHLVSTLDIPLLGAWDL